MLKFQEPKQGDIIYADERKIGEIIDIKNGEIHFCLFSNSTGSKKYSISLKNAKTWLYERLYKIKRSNNER